jgi:hypothetical protein
MPLAQFVEAIEEVVRDAVQEALRSATERQGVWPPDWDDLTLPGK